MTILDWEELIRAAVLLTCPSSQCEKRAAVHYDVLHDLLFEEVDAWKTVQ